MWQRDGDGVCHREGDDLQQKEEAVEEDGRPQRGQQPEKVTEEGATEVCRWNSPLDQQEAAMT